MYEMLFHLLPNFRLLRTQAVETQELSVWFWMAMVTILLLSLGFVLWHFKNYRARVRAINSLIKGQTKDELAKKRRETLQKASKLRNKDAGNLWREFDESLVLTSDHQYLHNTLDAEHFFNSRTLARGLTSSRLLAATPSFLVAIGVLGTFVGLTVGLSSLHVDSNDVMSLKQDVGKMINAASVAFMTSVWGVFFSLLLNLIEKLFERSALSGIDRLQREVDYLYPRIPAEQSLVHIADAAAESRKALQELHERIGDRLQQAVNGMSESMQQAITNALNNVMAPAIQSLVTNASQQSSQVMERLITQFVDGANAVGRDQGALMQQTSQELTSAMSRITSQMELMFKTMSERQASYAAQVNQHSAKFALRLEEQGALADRRAMEMQEKFQELLETLSGSVQTQLNSATQASQAQQQELTAAVNHLLKNMNESAEQQQANALQREARSVERFDQQVQVLAEEQQRLLSQVATAVHESQLQNLRLSEQHERLLQSLQESVASADRSSQQMASSASSLGMLSSNLKTVTELFDQRLQSLSEQLIQITTANKDIGDTIREQSRSLQDMQITVVTAAERIGQSALLANEGFARLEEHQKSFLKSVSYEFEQLGKSLAEQVGNLEEQAAEWLRDYSAEVRNQVQERMNTWNEETLSFANNMQHTVRAIGNLVDELEIRK